jgi:hypothetical protein
MYKSWLILLVTMCGFVQAQNYEELLEQAIYTEETIGDLKQAISLYNRIVNDEKAPRKTRATALHREGLCFMKRGSNLEGRLRFMELSQSFPEFTEMISAVQVHLPESLASPKFQEGYWRDGEMLITRRLNGKETEVAFMAFDLDTFEERPIWRISGMINHGGYACNFFLLVEKDSYMPIREEFRSPILGWTETTFADRKVDTKWFMMGNRGEQALEFTTDRYCFSQRIPMVRLMPFKINYQMAVPFFMPSLQQKLVEEFTVVKKETLKVPAGEFECFKISSNLKHDFWIDTSERRLPVRVTIETDVYDLERIIMRDPQKPQRLESRYLNLTLPLNWYHLEMNAPQDQERFQLISHDPSLVVVVDVGSKALKTFDLPGNVVPDTEEELKLGHATWSVQVGHFSEFGVKKLCYLARKDGYALHATMLPDDLSKNRKLLEQLLSSL